MFYNLWVLSDNFLNLFFLNLVLFLFSWFGVAFSTSFIEGFFFLEITYLSLIIFCTLFNFLSNFFLFYLFLIFILFFSICDSILGLILTLITFNSIQVIFFKNFQFLD